MINDAFLQAMSRAANTVCVVTTDGPAGKFGVTVSAMTSVSIDDAGPSLLVGTVRQNELEAGRAVS